MFGFFSSFFSFLIIVWEAERMLMMMMMLKKKKGSLAVMALLVASVNCGVVNPTKEHLSGEFHSKPAHFHSS